MSKSNRGAPKQNLTFVRQIPKFLQHTIRDEPNIQSKYQDEAEDYEGEGDDLIASKEEERPQVVVLNEKKHLSEGEVKKHYQDLGLIKKDEKTPIPEKVQPDYETPPVDASGRILFRTKKKDTQADSSNSNIKNDSENKLKVSADKRKQTSTTEKKQSKKAKKSNLLSFDLD